MQHRVPTVLVLLAVGFGSQPAAAAVDLSGRWAVASSFGVICLNIGQSGTTLSATECSGAGSPYSGTIDPMTGAFTLAQPPGCDSISIAATATPDSASFAGSLHFSIFHCTFVGCGCFEFDDSVVGTRAVCGDGLTLTGANEQCDDGNTANGDCCSSACLYEPFESPCSDGNPCTSNSCDGAGGCTSLALPDDTPCDDGNACSVGDRCAATVCSGADLCADPMKCYRAADIGQPRFPPTAVTLQDEYASVSATAIKPQAVCNPASLNAAPVADPAMHLTCFKIAAPPLTTPAEVESESALGTVQLRLTKPQLLCLPSAKTLLP